MKNIVGSLRGIAWNLLIVLGGIFIVTTSIRPLQEHMFLHRYVFWFISSVLLFYLSEKVKVDQSCLTLCNPSVRNLEFPRPEYWNG